MAHKIVIDGIIGGWDIDGRFVRNELQKAGGQDVIVELASPGGSVFDGLEIFNLFKNYSGNVHMHIMGLAASMASYIALSGNKITAEQNAVFMIHNPWVFAVGDHNDMMEAAKLLDGLAGILAKAYSNFTGKSIKEIRSLMDDETFFFGDEIKEAGFADEIIEGNKKETRIDALAYAQIAIDDCIAKIKEKGQKEDIQKAAAMLKIKPENNISTKNKTDSILSNNKPAESGKEEVSKTMITLETLKAENPDLYNSIIKAGIKQEHERVMAHVPWMDVAKEQALKAIQEGEEFTPAHLSEYSKASLTKQEIKDSIDDNPPKAPTPKVDEDVIENEINARLEAEVS